MENPITQAYLHEVFYYQDGELFWKVDRRKTKVGAKAGRTKSNGYCEVRLDGRLQGTHRLIFMMFHGFLPRIIDHIDGNPSNNAIENLREATHAENMRNSQRPKNNTSGFKGVYFDRRNSKWVSQCWSNNQKNYLGSFDDIHEAANAVLQFRKKNHGKFANHG
jgi:hypothetical protein